MKKHLCVLGTLLFFLLTSFNGVKQCLYDIVMPYSDAKTVRLHKYPDKSSAWNPYGK